MKYQVTGKSEYQLDGSSDPRLYMGSIQLKQGCTPEASKNLIVFVQIHSLAPEKV